MRTIRFKTDDPKLEEALRLIVFNGPVEHTGEFGMYRVPVYILTLLNDSGIEYEVVMPDEDGKTLVESGQE